MSSFFALRKDACLFAVHAKGPLSVTRQGPILTKCWRRPWAAALAGFRKLGPP